MTHIIRFLLLAAVLSSTALQGASFRKLMSLDGTANTGLHVWTDVVNVYILRSGENAVLIDLGDGSVLSHLHEIGVRRVEWVLFTHHHREQSQGYPLLSKWSPKIGAPEAERALFEGPTKFRAMKPALGDRFTVHGASFVRPGLQPIPLDRGFAKMDEFVWRGIALRAVDTRGNSPGGMSYLWKHADGWVAFSGDVMLAGARMHNWFDTEWDYSFAAGIYALHGSAALLHAFDPMLLLPSHGPEIRAPRAQLQEYQKKLEKLASLVVRGYRIFTFASADQDPVSKPTVVPHVWQVTPHIYKFKGPEYWPNMNLIVADNGHALAVDCGLFDDAFLDQALEGMRKSMGLKQIDACVISHMHGDHMLNAPYLRKKFGTQVWALQDMVNKLEHPERFDYAASVQSYRKGFDSVKVDRAFKPGETFDWQGYKLTIDWMPGQTEFALCLTGTIDGRKVAFTGDNIFANPADPAQNGHEAIVARNSGILEEGYIYGAEYLRVSSRTCFWVDIPG